MTRSKLWIPCFIMLVAAIVSPPAVEAGLYYEAVTRTEGQKGEVEVRSWVDGESARVEFESGGPHAGLPKGSYLVTRDGGRTLYLVNPKEKTYSKWDLQAMMETFGAMMESMGSMMSLEIANPRVEKLGEEPGGAILGLATTRHRYRSSYDLEMKVMGMNRSQHVDMEQEIWSTQAVSAAGLGVWLRADRPTGFEGLDELLKNEMGKIEGFPLRTVTVTTTTNKKGKSQVTRSTMEVTTLDQDRSIPADTFEIPAGYQETEMMPTAGEEGEGRGGNPLKGLFGGGKG